MLEYQHFLVEYVSGKITKSCHDPAKYATMSLTFEWDEEKSRINFHKHKVSFEEAKTVFNDPWSLTIPDSRHSESEDRFVTIGRSAILRILLVVYTERRSNLRIISCRKATPAERKAYEEILPKE